MNAKNDFDKDFYELMNNAVFGKTMENVRKHKIIELVNNDKKRNKLVSEPNYHATKWFSESLLAIEMKETSIKMNKPIYLGLAILSLSKILMYDYWYNEMKVKYKDRVRLCYMDTDSFIMHIKTEDFYKDIADGVEKKYDTSNYIIIIIGLRPKYYSYLTDDGNVDKKAKGTKKCVIKKRNYV